MAISLAMPVVRSVATQPAAHVAPAPSLRAAMVTQVFPNAVQPTLGVFNGERARFLAQISDLTVVAPVPFYPRRMPGLDRWRQFATIAAESAAHAHIHHPRRVVVPAVGDRINPHLYERALLRTLAPLHAERRFDVIDAHVVWPDGWAAVRVGRRLGIPVVVTAHGSDLTYMPRFGSIRAQIEATLRHADHVVTVSADLARIAEGLGADRHNLSVVPNGVDPVRFKPRRRRRCRRVLGIPPTDHVLLGVGALDDNKGFERIVPVVEALTRRGMAVRFVLIGEGPRRVAIQRRAAQLGVADRVHVVGAVPHAMVARFMAAADLLVLPSAREGWPTVLHEAWACGTPVAATDVGGIGEALGGRPELGTLLPDREFATLCSGIERSLRTPWDARALHAHGASRTWEHVATETQRCWQRAARHGQAGS